MATKFLQIIGNLGNEIYTQNDEPTDAKDGALWVDLDEDPILTDIEAALAEAKASGEFKGEKGDSGVYVGSGDMPDGYNVQVDPDGDVIKIPTKTSELENDSNFITSDDIGDLSGIDLTGYAKAEEVYTKQEIDNKGFVTDVDTTLTQEKVAADAKATGDRLGAIEYQTVTTEEAYEHKDLPEGEKTVTINGDGMWDTAYINFGENLVPNDGLSKSFPFNGVTVTQKGNGYAFVGTATKNGVVMFTDKTGNYKIPVDSSLIGKTINMYTFADLAVGTGFGWGVSFHASDTTQLASKSTYIANTKNNNMASVVVPSNTAYMQWSFNFSANKTFDNEVRFFGAVADNIQNVTLNGNLAEITNITSTEFSTFPYKSTINCTVPLKEFISNYAGGDTATYLTPEAYGAIGDGESDDIEAITTCLEVASETKQLVLMAKKYFITSPIDVAYNDMHIIINDIVYNGTETAVKIHGSRNTIKIHSVDSSAVGVAFVGEGITHLGHNNLEVNTITSGSHGITFTTGEVGLYQNTVRFNYIKAGGDGCYGIAYFNPLNIGTLGEDNFYGGQISCCEWACYGVRGNSKFYGIEIEHEVQGGFYIDGHVSIFHPRIAESQRDGDLPIYKFMDTSSTTIYDSSSISINQIDLTDAADTFSNSLGQAIPLTEFYISKINGKICARIPEIENGTINLMGNVYSTEAYVWGKHLILTPFMAYRKEITTKEFDTRHIGRTEETDSEIQALSQLPTKFVVGTIGTEIYLHSSYCAFGFNEFEVEQVNGFTCKIYDVLGNLIFDGSEQDDGLYKLKVYKDATYCSENTYGMLRRDFTGHYWQVTKETLSATDDGAGNVTLTTEVASV